MARRLKPGEVKPKGIVSRVVDRVVSDDRRQMREADRETKSWLASNRNKEGRSKG